MNPNQPNHGETTPLGTSAPAYLPHNELPYQPQPYIKPYPQELSSGAYPPTHQNPYPPQQNPYPPQQNYSGQQAPFPNMPPPAYSQPYVAQGTAYSPNQEMGGYAAGDSDSTQNIIEDANWSGFSDKVIRNAFVRKVFGILTLQLTFTFGIVCLFVFEKNTRLFVRQHIGVYIAAYVTFFALYITLICCSSVRRKHPHNLIVLGLFTMALTYLVATMSSFHETYTVLMAMGICAVCCSGVMIFSCFTKFDFTQCWGVVIVLSWVLFIFGIIAISTYRYYPILQTVYAGLGALFFMLFLAFDTQMLMGGKKYQLSPEEYIFASLQLYMDIVQIFMFLLMLMGGGKK